MASNFQNYIASLVGRGWSQAKIMATVKKNANYRSTTNANIKAAIKTVNAGKASGTKFQKGKGSDSLSSFQSKSSGKGSKNVTVNFTFYYRFPLGSSSGKVGGQRSYMSIDLPSGTTKSQARQAIMEMIDSWIEEHYQGNNATVNASQVVITSIQGV